MTRTTLPIDSYKNEIQKLILENKNLVLTAQPGAGKTTRVPIFCHEVLSGKILVLQPRRLAAMSAALRVREELGPQHEIGYHVRFDKNYDEKTQIIFMTEAMLIKRMQHDPELSDVALVIFDEFHERSAISDVALGLIYEMQLLGSHLKTCLMSATLEAERCASYLQSCPVLFVPGKLFPLEILYHDKPQKLRFDDSLILETVQVIKKRLTSNPADTLIFCPGVREIQILIEKVSAWATEKNFVCLALHGGLDLEEQKKVLQPHQKIKLIFCTNIAESSLTIDGVSQVIDLGLEKMNKFNFKSGFSSLELTRISKDSATQRAGRSARQTNGTAYRMWIPLDERSQPLQQTPEILRLDLSEVILTLASFHVQQFDTFSWYEKPHPQALQLALSTLQALGALDEKLLITNYGKKLVEYPTDLMTAHYIETALTLELHPHLIAAVGIFLNERETKKQALHRSEFECDVIEFLFEHTDSAYKFDPRAERQLLALITQKNPSLKITTLNKSERTQLIATSASLIKESLFLAFAHRLCRRREKTRKGTMVGGRGVVLDEKSFVQESPYFLALRGRDLGAESMISIASGFSEAEVQKFLHSKIYKKQTLTLTETGTVMQSESLCYMGLPVSEPTLKPASEQVIQEHLSELCVESFDQIVKDNERLSRWLDRWNFYCRFADIDENPLQKQEFLRELFQRASFGEKNVQHVKSKDLVYYVESLLDAKTVEKFNQVLPERILAPTGNSFLVHYKESRDPYIEIRLQEVFGWKQNPLIAGRPLVLDLLGPNYRLVQTTADLSSFWRSGYIEVRKEMRARYPKHSWPENPESAPPQAKGKSTRK